MNPAPRRLAVVGAGWAGISASVTARSLGWDVSLHEMSHQAGGRARSQADTGADNGQHILIGAYRETLALMRRVGVDSEDVLLRLPLALRMADGRGLEMGPGPAAPAFAAAVLHCAAWSGLDKLRLLMACGSWAAAGFRCVPDRSVAELCSHLPVTVRRLLIEPLCVSALNTPAVLASAAVFLRVLQDGLFGGPGACDLLLPRRPLHHLLPGPALRWLERQGVELHCGHRVLDLHHPSRGVWAVDDQTFDAVVLACSATEAARLLRPWAPAWSALADTLNFEPIVTVKVHCPGARLPWPMVALQDDALAPAQFVFDHGQISGSPGDFAFVISGAARWVTQGLEACARAVLAQAACQLPAAQWPASRARIVSTVAERRATFLCTPGLQRPATSVLPGLAAAGDYVEGPYPATLEGAVRAGKAAVACLLHDPA